MKEEVPQDRLLPNYREWNKTTKKGKELAVDCDDYLLPIISYKLVEHVKMNLSLAIVPFPGC